MRNGFNISLFDAGMMEQRRKRDNESLKRISDLCLLLEDAIMRFNDDQDYALTPLFRANETVNNIRIIAKIMADRNGELVEIDNEQEKENNEQSRV